MRKARVNALRSASASGAFLILHEHEVVALDALPLWMTRLFQALVRCSDFRTGFGSVAYAQLLQMLTPLQPRRGPRHYVPNLQALKKAVRGLEERCLLSRDKAHSQAEELLFFSVDARYLEARPKAKLEPQTRTPVDSRNASNGAASRRVIAKTRTPNSNPSFKN